MSGGRRVTEVMHKGMLMMDEDISVRDATIFMRERNIGAVGVMNSKGELIGIFSERDVINRVVSRDLDPRTTLLNAVMSAPVKTITDEQSVDEALVLMNDNRFRHLPVVNRAGQPVGLVGIRDLMKYALESAIEDFMSA